MKLGDLVYYITYYTGIRWIVKKYGEKIADVINAEMSGTTQIQTYGNRTQKTMGTI